MQSEILVVTSDLHCGSVVGLSTPSVETQHGNVVGFGNNHHQAWLWDCWQSMCDEAKRIVGISTATLVVTGDATEGSHHRNDADLIASDIEIHTNIAVACLKPLKALCNSAFVVKGTECHTANMENRLAQKLGAIGDKASDEWLIDIAGCLVSAKHHMGVTGRSYLEASMMSIHMGNARLNAVRARHRVPDVFLRGHRHCGGWFSDGAGLFGVTGGWQMLTRHGHKVVPDSIPSPTVLILDWRGRKRGSIPQVHEIKFQPPQDTIHSV